MTVIGWIQILLFCAIVVALVKPLGWYMTRVFNGERTLLSPVLRPVEAGLYWIGGVDEKREQHWLTYTVAMLLFHVGGFLILYAVMRLQAVLPFNPADNPPSRRICPSTPRSASSPTPTGRTTAAKARCPISCRCWA
jgi:K+-transporting ATPase ATPase A chain